MTKGLVYHGLLAEGDATIAGLFGTAVATMGMLSTAVYVLAIRCAGRGADLFESISGEIIGAMILGASLAHTARLEAPVSFICLAHMFFSIFLSQYKNTERNDKPFCNMLLCEVGGSQRTMGIPRLAPL